MYLHFKILANKISDNSLYSSLLYLVSYKKKESYKSLLK